MVQKLTQGSFIYIKTPATACTAVNNINVIS